MALKPTTCKEAMARWETETGQVAAEAKEVLMQFQWPPIEKMDVALSSLVNCEKLSLSSNMIDKIGGIAGMHKLKILALGRNNIKSLGGLETVADTLEELWISYNPIEKLKGVEVLKNLRVLYMSNCSVKEWHEIKRLKQCPALRDLVLAGNPICENQPDMETWRLQAVSYLEQIERLDGIPIVRHQQ
ncbi:Dynein light chain 1, axonemal [Eumeta japonica]|uniref:Dynein axonemal light chain 1 n=1 Tax=Eumeta variegata TaxID=151549 RepID=A0A4C1X059_EUMVA|nr:Dynein light chain 1, axonemal [Eumeta japonica]